MELIWCKSQEMCSTEESRAKVYPMTTLCLDLNNYTKNKAISFLFFANYSAEDRLPNKRGINKQYRQFIEYYVNKVKYQNM